MSTAQELYSDIFNFRSETTNFFVSDLTEFKVNTKRILNSDDLTLSSQWYSQPNDPAPSLGQDTDQFLNTQTGDVFQKTNGSWVSTGNIKGPGSEPITGTWTSVLTGGGRPPIDISGSYERNGSQVTLFFDLFSAAGSIQQEARWTFSITGIPSILSTKRVAQPIIIATDNADVMGYISFILSGSSLNFTVTGFSNENLPIGSFNYYRFAMTYLV